MSVVSPVDARQRRWEGLAGTVVSLAVLLGLLGIGGLQGGTAMVLDPAEPLGMSTSLLEGTPVHDYFWPGIFLLSLAVVSILTCVGLVFRWRWNWADRIENTVGFRWPWVSAVSIGGVLLVFEIIELFMIPFHPVMHPLLIAIAIAILCLASTRPVRSELRSEPTGLGS